MVGPRRAGALLAALAVLNLGFAALLIAVSYVTLDAPGQIPDFAAFWAAGRMTLEGAPGLAYDWEAHRAVEAAGLGREFAGLMPWHYPPPVQLLVAPLGALPLFVAMAVWVGGSLALFLYTCWRILPHPNALIAGLAAAPTAMTLVNGQVGFLLGALLGLALIEIDRRPLRAGLALGFLGLKPHLVAAILLPLIAAPRWRTVFAGGATVIGLAAVISWAVLGGGTWVAFWASLGRISGVFAGEVGKFTMYASPYGALRLGGLGFWPAMALHGVIALAALALTIRAWRSALTPEVKAALLCFAAITTAPRVLNYDLHMLVIGALFQVRHGLAAGFRPGEQLVLGAALVAGFLSMVFAPGVAWLLAPALFSGCWLAHDRTVGLTPPPSSPP